MKKTAMKVSAIIIALCVLFGAFPLSAAAYDDNTTDLEFNSWHLDTNYANIWQNSGTFEKNDASGIIFNNTSKGYIKDNFGQIGYNITSAYISYYYGESGNGGFVQTNRGTILENRTTGRINDNYGAVNQNLGVILYNRKDGTIEINQNYLGENIGEVKWNSTASRIYGNGGIISKTNTGTVEFNSGKIRQNGLDMIFTANQIGIVNQNESNGTIDFNEVYGEVNENRGTVTTNKGYVRNYDGGVVTTNAEGGRVYNYGGTVMNNSGSHFFQTDLTVAHATTVYGEGFSSDNGIDCWLPAGTNGVATITPDEGWCIKSIPIGSGITSAVRNTDGSWTVTVGGLSSNVSAGAFGIEASDTCTVTIDTGDLGDDITIPVRCGTNFFEALYEQNVFTALDDLSTDDCLFRDLATKPLDEFSDEADFGADSEALLNTTITSDMTVYACCYQKIKNVTLTLETPIVGTQVILDDTGEIDAQTPAPVITLADNAHCTVSAGSAQWRIATGEGSEILGGAFEYSKTYYAEMLLIPKFGWWLDEDTVVTANGAKVEESGGAMALYVCLSTQAVPLLGDADGDGAVTVLDATCIQRHLVDYAVPTFIEPAAKVCGAGTVSVLDATMIQRYAAEYSCNPAIGMPVA